MIDLKKAPLLLILTWLVVFIAGCKTSQTVVTPKGELTAVSLPSALLWKIEGDDVKTSYLFGTIHMIEKEAYFFTDEMENALKATQELVLEIDLEDAMDLGSQIGLLQKALMRNDTTLKDLLTDDEYDSVKDHFEKMGIPFFLFERVKPMFLTIFASEDMFSGGGLNMDEVKSYELELIEKAKLQNKPVDGLETVEYQMSIFDSIPYKAQAQMLVASLSFDEEGEGVMDTLIYYYKQQDLGKLDELLNSDPTTKEYRRVLLDNRNANWIPIISQKILDKPTFFAVGAGHLGGESGVINLLMKKGLRLTPIKVDLSGA
jgi:uncharacterized protein YbaP (TraB family)